MKKIYIVHAIFAAFLFGLSTPFSKLILNNNNSPLLLASLFYLGAAVFLLPFKIRNLKNEIGQLINNKSDLMRIVGAIIFGGITGPVALLYGIKYSSPESASLLLNMETVATSLFAWFIFKEHLSTKVILSSILTVIAGSLLVINFNLNINYGGILVILACIFWGIDNNLTANVTSISPTVNTILKGFFAGTFNFLLFLIFEHSSILWDDFFYALIIGAFCYGLSIILYISSARNIGASRSQIIFSINPFMGSLVSYIIFQTSLGMEFMIAFLLMIIAISLLMYERHHHEHTHHEIDHLHEHCHDDNHHNHHHTEFLPGQNHSHQHTHNEITHSHIHYPDIHHKHEH